MHLNDIQKMVAETARQSGWYVDPITKQPIERNIGEVIALMHSELSEALEEWRKHNCLNDVYYNHGDKPDKPEGFGIELADCVIRILDTAEAHGINIEELIILKDQYNRTRGFRHGGLKA